MFRMLLCSVALLALGAGSLMGAEKKAKEKEGAKSPPPERQHRLSDVVFLLVEMSDTDQESREELQHMYDVLRKLDTNKDGKLDNGELEAARQQLLAERVDDLIQKLDTDKDGRISKDEARGRLKEDFDKIDTNQDGYISRDELMKAVAAGAKKRGKELRDDKATP